MATKSEFLDMLKEHGFSQTPSYGALGAIGGGIGAFINGNQAIENNNRNIGAYDELQGSLKAQMDAMPTLASMYGQDSPYAQQMRQRLSRLDAKAGRNSQYGPREAQLQAALADKGSQYSAQQAQMAQAFNTARIAALQARGQADNANLQVRGQQLGSLFDIGNKTGLLNPMNKMIEGWGGQGAQKLSDMFSGGGAAQPNAYSQGGPSTGVYGMPSQSAAFAPEQSAGMNWMDQAPIYGQDAGGNTQQYMPTMGTGDNAGVQGYGDQELWYGY